MTITDAPTLPGTATDTAPTPAPAPDTDIIDTGELSASAHMLKRMSIGEWLTSTQIAADYGVSSSLLKVAVNAFSAKGVRFDKQKIRQGGVGPMLTAYTLSPGQDVSEFIVPPRNNQAVGVARGERNGQAKARGNGRGNGRGSGRGKRSKPDLTKRGALIAYVADHLAAHAGATTTAEELAEALGLKREQARGVLVAMMNSTRYPVERVATGIYCWDDSAHTNGNGSANGVKSNGHRAEAISTRHRAKSPVHVPADDHDSTRGPSAAASAMLGFDTHGAPPVPTLGSLVRVVGAMLDEDTGDVKLMVKNAHGTWVTDVDAVRMGGGDGEGDEE